MQITSRRNAFGKKIVKVVFTGGPCAGKSTSIERAKELIDKQYGDQWNCYTVAEAASVMYSTGRVSRDELIGPRLKQWQRDIVECVLTFEKVFDNIAAGEPTRHTIILCDRGALDPKVFTPLYMWPQILDEMATTERELMARYDLVLVLHTAPDVNYTTENNRLRREGPEQARKIDMKYAEVWQEHHRVIEIEANRENGMEEKFGDVWAQLEQLMNCD
ncbi:hypothetical protein PRIPAC_90345 [Pristionchus pacificus]|uniref:AAA_28 domain-containing protein n=1 Tax=Pristionchus pacificus TaxID=54126 RepID=A0A454XLT3_PRIPA|nr:hypothetical protein PRIPAC_90345 [Pristionchus pacificus]|eukprot:PDM60613.1 hypothetical protein PRIPAC_53591 [Pristionchus pacificus]